MSGPTPEMIKKREDEDIEFILNYHNEQDFICIKSREPDKSGFPAECGVIQVFPLTKSFKFYHRDLKTGQLTFIEGIRDEKQLRKQMKVWWID